MNRIFLFALGFSAFSCVCAEEFSGYGSPGDVLQKFQSNGKVISVLTSDKVVFGGKDRVTGPGFRTYVVVNLPESYVVGAAQSEMTIVEGSCNDRTFQIFGTMYFSGKDRSGSPMDSLPYERVRRKPVPKSPFEKAFDFLCKKAIAMD